MVAAEAGPSKSCLLLHLGGLNLDADTADPAWLAPFLKDVETGLSRLDRALDVCVICGSVTRSALPDQFQRARRLIERLLAHFGLSRERLLVVPGRNDLDQDLQVYRYYALDQLDLTQYPRDRLAFRNDVVFVRENDLYPKRFAPFAQHFWNPLTGNIYPLDFAQQYQRLDLVPEEVCFRALNSCWNTDTLFPERCAIHEAVKTEIHSSERVAEKQSPLEAAVVHHPLRGRRSNLSTLAEELACLNFHLVLHGSLLHQDDPTTVYAAGKHLAVAADGFSNFHSRQNYNLIHIVDGKIDIYRRIRLGDNAWQAWPQNDDDSISKGIP